MNEFDPEDRYVLIRGRNRHGLSRVMSLTTGYEFEVTTQELNEIVQLLHIDY
ncbi:MAG TPA: hypothetical protein VJ891_09645 [Casimicrobiaceae bacterium]|nr:hypothetical protein [Casimicrobiaceae bacterium]